MNNDLNKHFKDAEELALAIMDKYPWCKTDHSLFLIAFFDFFEAPLNPEQKQLIYKHKIGTLRRVNQHLRQTGKVQLPASIKKQNKRLEAEYRDHFKEKRQFVFNPITQSFREI